MLSGCSSKRKRKDAEPSKLNKFYHNTTALYNGYFNANEIMEQTYLQLKSSHKDNYNELLPLYDYVSIEDPKAVYGELDRAIEKVTTVASLHEPSKWVDDCYVLMGEAQYLKQEYETAEETFTYFKDEFNPDNPFGRNYKKKKKSKKQIKKEKDKERKQAKKEREEEKREEKKQREEDREAKKKAKEESDKARAEERKQKKKEREAEQKRRKKKSKKSKKRKKGKKRTKKSREERDQQKEAEADKTAYSKGMMWYAKTLVKRDKLSNASYLVKRMAEDGLMPEDARREVPVILADINIKEKNYGVASDYLDEAIELADDKSLKARYAFVQGQLHLRDNDYGSAATSFAQAKKWAKSFEMEFMSELNVEKSAMLSGGKSKGGVITINSPISSMKRKLM